VITEGSLSVAPEASGTRCWRDWFGTP